ncbi:hypothetical protein [Acanthopleuribacter pedis]|uniref:Uncharacterized protein n=1 Tax=Acanthopleuribacter pedis TaxID=442870 RepID=A0A8J7U472_9BACT|nr:hypothetical protein [Acanthopleuribacter pedis]MBO1321183.1 hypothetical protein [Acanthopleuribacter pedis]
MTRPAVKHVPLFKPEPQRVVLSLFFMVFAAFAANGLFPLPEEPARVQFWDLTLTVTAFAVAMKILISRNRLFHLSVLAWCGLGYWYIGKRLKEMEMALMEPAYGEQYLVYALAAAAVLLITPWVWRLFPDWRFSDKPLPPILFRDGIRY